MTDDKDDRIAELERENAELRMRLDAKTSAAGEAASAAARDRPSRPQLELITQDDRRRSRVARIMLVGGAAALLSGVFSSSWFAVLCGLGWLIGGAAVASTVPQSGGDS